MATDTANVSPAPRRSHMQHVHYLRANITYLNVTAGTVIGSVPAGTQLLHLISGVYVSAAFNAGTTNTLDIGSVQGAATTYSAAGSLTAKAFVTLNATIATVNSFYISADTTFTYGVNLSGTTATAGTGTILLAFVPNQ